MTNEIDRYNTSFLRIWCISNNSSPLSNHSYMCFGCDEGRNGKTLSRKIKIEGIPKMYEECICEGCLASLNVLREFIPPIVQEYSHEGYMVWRIPKYVNKKFRDFYKRDIANRPNGAGYPEADEYTEVFDFSDGGDAEEFVKNLMHIKNWLNEEYTNGINVLYTESKEDAKN